jgi:uncharacterized lipoprotein NlpE involved in copper resistance
MNGLRKKSIVLILSLVIILFGCNKETSPDKTTDKAIDNGISQNNEVSIDRAEEFLDSFSIDYQNYEILDYVIASEESYPIVLVAIAENKDDTSSSTLFIVDTNGVGKVVLASDTFAVYRKEDGLTIDKNVIYISLDLKVNDTDYEINDFEITVTQAENQGVVDTTYSSKQVIRSN